MNLPYYFEENIERIRSLAKEPTSLRTSMLMLKPDEFNKIKYSLPSTTKFLRDFERTVKAVNIERSNDYPAMIKQAKKRFNKLDIAILELLLANEEGAYYLRGVKDHVTEAIIGVHPGLSQDDALKKSIKLLKRRGLIEVATGLFDEDGFTAGSGYMAVDHKRSEISQIIDNFNGEPESLSLL